MLLTLAERVAEELDVVGHVVGEDRPPFGGHPCEELVVGKGDEIGPLDRRLDIVAAGAKLAGYLGRKVLVEEQPQPTSSCWRRQLACSRSASAFARDVHSSISSV